VYTVSEVNITSPWVLAKIVCTGATNSTVLIGSDGDFDTGDTGVSISLAPGETITCTFTNGIPTRTTQGFWSTRFGNASSTWLAIPASERQWCSPIIKNMADGVNGPPTGGTGSYSGDVKEMEGGFWSSISKKSTGASRTSVEQARMQMVQQLLAAMLNVGAFGAHDGGLIATAKGVYCSVGSTRGQILEQASLLAAFNESGDSFPFPPGFVLLPTAPQTAKAAANKPYWNTLP
jgi:hypothetical protein